MRATATTDAPRATDADTIVVGLLEDEGVAHDVEGAPLAAGRRRRGPHHLPPPRRRARAGPALGARRARRRDDLDAERARRAAAAVHGRAQELGTRVLCWELPHKVDDALAAALVEGTVLAGYRFDRYKTGRARTTTPPGSTS